MPKNLTSKKKAKPSALKKLPSAWKLTKKTAQLIWENKKLFLLLTLVYGILSIVLVKGFSSASNVGELKEQLNQVFTGNLGSLASGLGVFVALVGSSGSTPSETGGAYQFFLGIVTSLAIIWTLRQLMSGVKKLRVRDAYYQGMYPLVPFILVLLIMGIQMLPMLIGSSIYSLVVTNGIAIHLIEKVLWFGLFVGLSALSLYWLSSSLIALYIVTLPNMTPIKALRSAKELVQGRRLAVVRKVLWLPLVMLITSAILMLPIIIWITPLAQWVFFLLTMFVLVVVHAYMYGLYRELLGE